MHHKEESAFIDGFAALRLLLFKKEDLQARVQEITGGAVVQQLRLSFFIVFMLPQKILDVAVADLTQMLRSAQLTAPIYARYPLEQITQAHDSVDAKSTIGNVVIIFDE